jgi:hypothetical protein
MCRYILLSASPNRFRLHTFSLIYIRRSSHPLLGCFGIALFTGDKASCLDEFIDETHRMSLAERLECEYRIMPAVIEPTFNELERI